MTQIHITRDTRPAWRIHAERGEWLEAAKVALLDEEAPRDFALTAALIANSEQTVRPYVPPPAYDAELAGRLAPAIGKELEKLSRRRGAFA